jgi:NAD(P)H-dependent FMN reductase
LNIENYEIMRIEIISGSPRSASTTSRIALHLQHRLQKSTDHEVDILDVRDFPLPLLQKVYTSVEDAPDEHKELAKRMFAADAFIIVTPEYNGSYSPAMQNVFDHFPKQHRKPFGLVTASPGALGGIRAAMQLQQFILALFGIPSPYMLVTPHIEKKFDAEGNLVDESFAKSVDVFINEYLWLAEKLVTEKVEA